jgi:ATP-dependent Clp protease ATP-binding subunit ClpB
VKSIQRNRAGLKDPNKPIGSFIFLGPTGVGKTQLAKVLAKYLFDSYDNLIRIDMSEYMEKFSVSRLIGSPPGYVGYDEGGQLTEAVRRRPYCVILFDEIEKAHPDVFNVLLQVLDDGRLTDGQGRIVDFKNCIIIMTSNLASDRILEADTNQKLEEAREAIQAALKAAFRPEFLNRIDEVITFRRLEKSFIAQIVTNQIGRVQKRLESRRLSLEFSQRALDFLADAGYDPLFGARPVKRAVQTYVENPLAKEILAGKYPDGSVIRADCNGSGIVFEN